MHSGSSGHSLLYPVGAPTMFPSIFPALRSLERGRGLCTKGWGLPAPCQSGGTLETVVADGWPGGAASKRHAENFSVGSPELQASGEVPLWKRCPCTTPRLTSLCAAA